tara:strand:- start:425 stop:841 length:417 start_codon:yes stop_codon:yes gene_type:complete
MNDITKNTGAYRTIGEITKELGLINKKTGNLQTHTLRYWETQFKQIRPLIKAGNRRYYSNKDFKIIKFVKFMLKDRGLTINGVKKLLNNLKTDTLDENMKLGIYNKPNSESAKVIKNQIKKISKIIGELSDLDHGKKN